jgi:predicted flap endonuclease-1-like 5' DNA nuclease
MQWLVANMWMALAAAGILGLLFGVSLRGLMTGGKIRRAQVERDVAKTELEQTRGEVDALYAAQRKRQGETAQAVSGSEELRTALSDREVQLARISDELEVAKAELEALKSEKPNDGNLLETAGAAIAGAVGGAALAGGSDKELTELKDRNAWLEARVASLETEVSQAQHAIQTEQPDTVLAAASADEETSADNVAAEKMAWQNTYLRQRVEALEANLIEAPAIPVVAAPVVEESAYEVETEDTLEAEVVDTTSDEEMARLRWRNRYLEGRLAYYEEAAEAEEASEEEDDDRAGLIAASAAALADTGIVSEALSDDENEQEGTEESLPQIAPEEAERETQALQDTEQTNDQPEAEAEAEAEAEVHPSDALMAELDVEDTEEDEVQTTEVSAEQPIQIAAPANGGDNLTAIGGIGPRIAEVLNGLGIWTYAQVADWTPANETWIEEHLSFKGRVDREQWVEQAKVLVANSAE